MKKIILSADGDSVLYLVPDEVADNLKEYCLKFCSDWLWNSPDEKRYRVDNAVCYTEADFIDYLNTYVFLSTNQKWSRIWDGQIWERTCPKSIRTIPTLISR